jgi:hypothetical protein
MRKDMLETISHLLPSSFHLITTQLSALLFLQREPRKAGMAAENRIARTADIFPMQTQAPSNQPHSDEDNRGKHAARNIRIEPSSSL